MNAPTEAALMGPVAAWKQKLEVPAGTVNGAGTTTSNAPSSSPLGPTTLLDAALAASELGLSVLPTNSKAPAVPWKQYQAERPSDTQLRRWFAVDKFERMGVVCGKVSGNLEMVELEGRFVNENGMAKLIDAAKALGTFGSLSRVMDGYTEKSPRGGAHWLYRCDAVEGNQVLAKAEDGEVLIETRGEGGFVVCAPSVGYQLVSGGFEEIATITPPERLELLEFFRTFDRTPTSAPVPVPTPGGRQRPAEVLEFERPGDAYNRTHPISTELLNLGFEFHRRDGTGEHWTRPGKDPKAGSSATVYQDGKVAFWSSTCVSQWPALELGHDKTYDAFGLLAATKYGGDFGTAARDLGVNDENLMGSLPRSERAPAGVVDLSAEPSRTVPKSRFQVTPLEELWALPDHIDWLVEGVWVKGSYGQLAGQMKTLKSHLATMITIAVAGKVRLLGTFDVPTAQQVLYFVGEGGMVPWKRRLDRLAKAMGIRDPQSLPIHPIFEVGSVRSEEFQVALKQHLAEIKPGLVILDPWYAYHGTESSGSNLYDEGNLLTTVSQPCSEAGAALIIVNHFPKTRDSISLSSINMAGSGEHADSWILAGHHAPAEVERGHFQLQVDIGSRQWGGQSYRVEIDLGCFDVKAGEHIGEPAWRVQPTDPVYKGLPKSEAKSKARQRILEVVADADGEAVNKTSLYGAVRGNKKAFEDAYEELIGDEYVVCTPGGKNGHAKMLTVGPRYRQMVGDEPNAPSDTQTNPTNADRQGRSAYSGADDEPF